MQRGYLMLSHTSRSRVAALGDAAAHDGAMSRLLGLWDRDSADLSDWQISWRHLTADGKAAQLTHPSAANQTLDFPPPVQPPPSLS